MTRELQRAIQAMAVECDDTYAMADSVEDMLEEIFDDHEAQLKAKDEEIERLKEAIQEFVNRCDKGEVRSRYTYSKFKELLKDKK